MPTDGFVIGELKAFLL